MQATTLNLFCARLNQAVLSRQLLFQVGYSPIVLKFLDSLKKNHLIFGYVLNTSRSPVHFTLTVYLIYYHNLPLFSHLFIYSTKQPTPRISQVALLKFQSRQGSHLSPIFFWQTPSGFLSQYQVTKKQLVGGRLFACLFS